MSFDSLLSDLRFAIRALLRRPAFAALALLTLGLGIGANTAIFSVVRAVILKPLPYENPDQLVILWEEDPNREFAQTPASAQDFFAWRDGLESVDGVIGGRQLQYAVTGSGQPEHIPAFQVSAEFFDVFGVAPILGRGFDASETQPGENHKVVLSHGLWTTRWGQDRGVIGQTVDMEGTPHEIIGVMPAGFAFPTMAQMWTPLVIPDAWIEDVNRHFLTVLARVSDGRTVDDVDREIARIADLRSTDFPESNEGWRANARPLHDQMTQGVRGMLWLLFGAVGFVLLIACVNVANLLLVRASGRTQELSVRAALGAGKGRIVRQLLTESVVLSVGGTLIGVLGAWLAIRLLLGLSPIVVPAGGEVQIDLAVLGFAVFTAFGAALLFGAFPAVSVWRSDLNSGLRSGTRGGAGGAGGALRSFLVVTETALAMILVTGAGLMLQTVGRLMDVETGMDVENVVTAGFSLPSARYPEAQDRILFYERLVDRARQMPGVEAAVLNPWLPPGGGPMFHVRIEGVHDAWTADLPLARSRTVSDGYFEALGIPLLQGRPIEAGDRADSELVAVVDQAFVDVHFPGEDPLGKQIRTLEDVPRTIVGVVGNVMNAGIAQDAGPTTYLPYGQAAYGFGQRLILKTAGDPESFIPALREVIWEMDGDLALNGVETLESRLSDSVSVQRFNAVLLASFAGLALLLAAIGIYGVMSFTVRERTRELGVRMALGASGRLVQMMVLRRAAGLVVTGVVVGVVASLGLSQVISSFLFGVEPTDPRTLIGVVGMLCGVGLLASWVPAFRASRLQPQVALRDD